MAGLIELARLRIVGMVLVSTAIGYLLSYRLEFCLIHFAWVLCGTALLSAGACTLNCFIEREKDALMPRTSNRPIPRGTVSPRAALNYGTILIVSGACCLILGANVLSGALGLIAVFVYLALYTPAKQITWLNTTIGSVPGAIPPMIGWAAATGRLETGAWVLFAMLVIWQHTHFFPIAWLYKSDYEAAGFQMLPVLEKSGEKTFRLTLVTAVILYPVSLLLWRVNEAGSAYLIGATVGGALLIFGSWMWLKYPTRTQAKRLLYLSLVYLPLILSAVAFDKYGAHVTAPLQQSQQWLNERIGLVSPWI